MRVEELASTDELTSRAVSLFVDCMHESVAARGAFLVALAGGNTPKPVYEKLSHKPYGNTLPWNQTQIFFGDERMVPCDHQESNYRMACETLLDHIPIPPWNLHRIAGEVEVDEAARLYNKELRRLGEETHAMPPKFDLILLGLGPDGHTVSLFPGTEVLENMEDLAAPVRLPPSSEGAKHSGERVTLTYPVINAARHIAFLVSGEDKLDALKRVENGDESAPAARVRPREGDVQWLVVRA